MLFDSDPNLWIHMFAHGWGSNTILHPLANYVFTIPIRIIEILASVAGLVNDPVAFRESLVLYISPLSSALMAVLMYITFRKMEFDHLKAFFVACLTALGFSSLAFGSIPSVYTLTSFSNSLLMILALSYSINARKLTHICFVIVGLFTVGITISNIIHVGWLYWFIFLSNGSTPFSALIKSVSRSAAILATLVALFFAMDFVIQRDDTMNIAETKRYIGLFTPTPMEQAVKLARFPEIVARTIIPTIPVEMPSYTGTELGGAIKVQVSISTIEFGISSIFLSIAALVAVGGGAVIAYKQGGVWRNMALASVATIVTFGVLHSLFGAYIYLYSQTWFVPCVFLLAAWMKTPFFNTRTGFGLIGVMLVLLLLGDIYVLKDITETITPVMSNIK